MKPEKLYDTIKYVPRKPEGFVRRKNRRPLSGLDILCCCAGWGKSGYLYQLYEEASSAVYLCVGHGDNSRERLESLVCRALSGRESTVFDVIGRLAEHNTLLLIDNADFITDPAAGELLSFLAEAACGGDFRMVMACRRVPGFMLQYVMDGRAGLLGIDDMRLDKGEIRELCTNTGKDLNDKYIGMLDSFCGGWCAAVRTVIRSGSDDLRSVVEGSFLPEYVRREILSDMEPELLEYMFRTAFLPAGNNELAESVLELDAPGFYLGRLVNRGIVPQGGYPVYPEALRYILCTGLSADVKKRLTDNASDYYIRSKRFAEAVRLFDESGNAAGAERLLRLYGDRLLANFEFELIGCCGRIITGQGTMNDPEALGAMAQYYYYSGNYEKMEQAYNLADSMFGKENKFSVYRRLYKGLLRYSSKPDLYRRNVMSALDYLHVHSLPLPFLYQKELDVLQSMTDGTGQETPVLTVNRFGGLRLLAGQQQTEIQCKTKRSAELIAYLMETGERPVNREELLNAFWPEEMPANAVAMLHNMIYHLRRELTPYGIENIISYKNKCYSLDMTMLRDADSSVTEICTALERGDKELALQKGEADFSYWGSYLGSTDIPWANEKREYYDRCYIDLCRLLAEHFRAGGQPEKELEVLKNAFRLEPYSEQLLYELLGCFKSLGKPDKARQYYEEYAERLDNEFGTRPGKWLRNRFLSCFSENDTDADRR